MPGDRVPLIARAVGSRILRPRPSLAIVCFWQGIVEVVLRSVALVLALLTIVPAALTLSKIHSVSNEEISVGGCAVVVGVGVIGVVLQTAMLILRFVNIGLINMNFRIFGTIDMVMAGSCAVVFLVGTIITGYSAHDQSVQSKPNTEVIATLGAAAGLSFFSMLAFSTQAIWMFIFVLLKWNKHVVTYTLRDAILS